MSNTRIASLDLIRGVAVLGILFMNITVLAGPWEAYYSPLWRSGLSDWEVPLFHLQSLVFDARFMSMFSLLFGVGLYIQFENAIARGVSPKTKLYARLRWLLVFGLLHGFFLFVGDILTLYACCGLVLLRFLHWSARKQLAYACGFLLLGQALLLLQTLSVGWLGESLLERPLPLSTQDLGALRALWTHYPERLGVQGQDYAYFLLTVPFGQLWYNLALMLFGVVLYRKGFFHQSYWWPWGALSLCIGLLVGAGVQFYRASMGWHTDAGLSSTSVMMLAGLFSALGYMSILVALAHRTHWLLDAFKQVGKMAFSLYIGQSLLAYIFFVWLFPALWGQWGRLELLSLVAVFSAVQLGLAHLWQKHWGQGPLERLWRWLAR